MMAPYLMLQPQALLHQSRPPAVVDVYGTRLAAGRAYIYNLWGRGGPGGAP